MFFKRWFAWAVISQKKRREITDQRRI
jgi:hypothetical protein